MKFIYNGNRDVIFTYNGKKQQLSPGDEFDCSESKLEELFGPNVSRFDKQEEQDEDTE